MTIVRELGHMGFNKSTFSEINNNYQIFQAVVDLSDYFLKEKQYGLSAVCAQLAATHAFVNHCGVFVSSSLELILKTIGCNIMKIPSHQTRRVNFDDEGPKHVLHVLSSGRPTGGDTRYVWRWIQEDVERRHSVVLTRQRKIEIPNILSDAVVNSGGSLYVLDKMGINLISQAQELRDISTCADLIVLHIFPDDVLPVLAFADNRDLPPISFINHSDHTFWIGSCVSDTVTHLRDCSLSLSKKRRGLPIEKITFLPTPLGSKSRKLTNSQAKKELGYDDDTIILLTIATAFKYIQTGKLCLLDLLKHCLATYEKVILLAVGPEPQDIYREGYGISESKIVALGKRSDTAMFYEAADIYIDSYPFSSITSLLEAGSYGLPVVTYCPYSDEAKVLGAGAPGLSGVMFQCNSSESYVHTLSKLIEDENFRQNAGEKTMRQIYRCHCGVGWKISLIKLYAKTLELAKSYPIRQIRAQDEINEIDEQLNKIYDFPGHFGASIDQYAYSLPYLLRVRLLMKLVKIDKTFSFSMFLPKWLENVVSGKLTFWRRLPGVDKWLNSQSNY